MKYIYFIMNVIKMKHTCMLNRAQTLCKKH